MGSKRKETKSAEVVTYDYFCGEAGSLIGGPVFEFADSAEDARNLLNTLKAELEIKVGNEIACIGDLDNYSPYSIWALRLSLPAGLAAEPDLGSALRSKIEEFGEEYLERRAKGSFGAWYTPRREDMPVAEILELLSEGLERWMQVSRDMT